MSTDKTVWENTFIKQGCATAPLHFKNTHKITKSQKTSGTVNRRWKTLDTFHINVIKHEGKSVCSLRK